MDDSVTNFSVKTLEIGGLGAALQALRLPYGKEVRSKVESATTFFDKDALSYDKISYRTTVDLDEKDRKLLQTLIKRGDEHSKVLRGVMVWFEVNAPRYYHVELDTYRIGAERLGSESTMHIQGQGLSTEELVSMKAALPEGTMQKRIWMMSYQTLRRIYFQRRNHRLPQWQEFCKWIETLPFAKEFITLEKDV